MNNLINQLKLVIYKYKEIEKINGTKFNIFSILNMERKEVKTHSNFIYELLNKSGLHGKGSIFLELFLTEVLKIEDYGNIKNIKAAQEDLTLENRRIDFTIETSKYQIGIEMKIDAKDQQHQMYDYYQELNNRLKENQNIKLYYLTLDGKKPSDYSLIKDDQNKLKEHNYELISFNNHIIQWINKCIKECSTSTIIREALVQYLNLVKIITNQSNSKGEIMEMINILSNDNNLEIFLKTEKEALKETKIQLQLSFWKNLKEKLDNNNFKFNYESNNTEKNIEEAVAKYYKENKSNKDYGYTHYLDENKDIYYCIWVNDYIFYEIGSLKNNIKFNNITKSLGIICEKNDNIYYDNYKEMLNFNDLLDTPNIFKLFDKENLNTVTENIIEEIIESIENMYNALKIGKDTNNI